MNCFQLIKTVLDEAYAAIPGSDAQRDAAIATQLAQLSNDYHNLLLKGCLDYSNPARRFAYVFRYTTAHANLVYRRILASNVLRAVFDRPKVQITCVGGGPGSDFLGILKYCERAGKAPELKCLLLDRDPAWGESWSDVDDKVQSTLRLATVFNSFDVTKPDEWRTFTKHYNSDLFTLIYFVSEVYAMRTKAEPYFDALFSNMRHGSLLLFIDNNDSRFVEWFDQLTAKHGLVIVEKDAGVCKMPLEEEKRDLEPYFTKFGAPKLDADVAWRVVRK